MDEPETAAGQLLDWPGWMFPNLRQAELNRYKGLLRDTWWAWVTIVTFGIVGGVFVSRIFLSAIPIAIFSFFYFGVVRYDNDGNVKEM